VKQLQEGLQLAYIGPLYDESKRWLAQHHARLAFAHKLAVDLGNVALELEFVGGFARFNDENILEGVGVVFDKGQLREDRLVFAESVRQVI
jgi:hypothetical protein